MHEIIKNLFIGDDTDCNALCNNGVAIIHACKTCHLKKIGYSGNLNKSHPNYLILEDSNDLYLNLVDMERELLPEYTHPIMKSALRFIDKHIAKRNILIHCNHGFSRSPSIALVYLAKKNIISNHSYDCASKNFLMKYPSFLPGLGIQLYLNRNWDELMYMNEEN